MNVKVSKESRSVGIADSERGKMSAYRYADGIADLTSEKKSAI